jgi:hypothetical protein
MKSISKLFGSARNSNKIADSETEEVLADTTIYKAAEKAGPLLTLPRPVID